MPEWRYQVYGLNVRSNLELPELCSGDGAEDDDIRIRLASPPAPDGPEPDENFLRFEPQRAELVLKDAVRITIAHGSEIAIYPLTHCDLTFVRAFIVGNALGLLLAQRGCLVLHASVVLLGGEAVAFCGQPGAGKSTLAAACCQSGGALVSDDVAPIRFVGGQPLVYSGYPRLKLAPGLARELGFAVDPASSLHSVEKNKRACRAEAEFAPGAFALRRIYLVADGAGESVRPVAAPEALVNLLPHLIPMRFGVPGDADVFGRLAQLLRQATVYHLLRRRSRAELPEVVRFIEEHLGASCPGPV